MWIWNYQHLSYPFKVELHVLKPRPPSTFIYRSILSNGISVEVVKNLLSCTWLEFVVRFELAVAGSRKTSNQWKINSVCCSFIFIVLQTENRNLRKEMSKRTKEKPLTTSGWFRTCSMKHSNLLFLIQNAL